MFFVDFPVQFCRQACMYHLVLNQDLHVHVSIFSIKCSFHFCQLPRDLTLQKGCADTAQVIAHKCQWIPSRKLTYPPLKVAVQKMFLLFHRWDMGIYGICSQEGILNSIFPPWDQRFRTSSPWSLLTWFCRPCSSSMHGMHGMLFTMRFSLCIYIGSAWFGLMFIPICGTYSGVWHAFSWLLFRFFTEHVSFKLCLWNPQHDMIWFSSLMGHIISLLGKKRHDLHFWWLALIGWMVLWWYT